LGDYLKGKVIVIDKFGNKTTILKEIYYSQTGTKENWDWVSHKSKEAKLRKR
jgi:S-adenosylmethionine hydrolase